MGRKLTGILLFVALVTGVSPAWAGELVGDEVYVLAEGRTIPHNLHVLANAARIDGVVGGDLIIGTTGSVSVGGLVEGDVLVFGGSVRIDGTVEGDIRGVAGSVTLGTNALVTGDIVVLSGRVVTDGSIQGDLQTLAYSTQTKGSIAGNIDVLGSSLSVQGEVVGSIHTHLADVALSQTARVLGDVVVTQGLEVADGAFVQGSSRQILERQRPLQVRAALLLSAVIWVLVLLLLAPAVNWVAPSWLERRSNCVADSPLSSLGRGFAVWFVPPALAGALLIVAGQLPLDMRPVVQLVAFGVGLLGFALLVAASLLGFVPALVGLGNQLLRGKGTFISGYVAMVVALVVLLQVDVFRMPVVALIAATSVGAMFGKSQGELRYSWLYSKGSS